MSKDTVKEKFVMMFCSELIGTALLMFLGCMSCISSDDPAPSHYMGSISFGLCVMLIIQLFGHISGAHLNPGVTLATLFFKMLSIRMAGVYITAQFLGATLGYGLLKLLLPSEYVADGFCVTLPHKLTTPLQALFIEIIITTVLILVCCAVWDKRNAEKTDSTPLRFGLIITMISAAAGPFTGASMNTARSFAPIVFSGDWTNQWIYWIGPNVGAILGCLIYKYIFTQDDEESTEDDKEENLHLEEINSKS